MIRLVVLFCFMSVAYAINLYPKQNLNAYWFYNASTETVWLNHETNQPMSAGWATSLSPGRYAILLLGQHPGVFKMTCSQLTPHFHHLSCRLRIRSGRLFIARVPGAFEGGNFWLTEDSSWNTTIIKMFMRDAILLKNPIAQQAGL